MTDFKDDEYVVFNPNQQHQQFCVEFRYKKDVSTITNPEIKETKPTPQTKTPQEPKGNQIIYYYSMSIYANVKNTISVNQLHTLEWKYLFNESFEFITHVQKVFLEIQLRTWSILYLVQAQNVQIWIGEFMKYKSSENDHTSNLSNNSIFTQSQMSMMVKYGSLYLNWK